MAILKLKEIRALSEEDLNKKIIELKKELIKLNGQISTGTAPKNPRKPREIKKTIARIITIIQEKGKNKEGSKKDE